MKDNRFLELFGSYDKSKLLKFWEWHQENPQVYTGFLRLAEKWLQRGVGVISANAIYNVLRYEIITTTGEPFKLRNEFAPLYARLLVWRMPEYEGMFDFRK